MVFHIGHDTFLDHLGCEMYGTDEICKPTLLGAIMVEAAAYPSGDIYRTIRCRLFRIDQVIEHYDGQLKFAHHLL